MFAAIERNYILLQRMNVLKEIRENIFFQFNFQIQSNKFAPSKWKP